MKRSAFTLIELLVVIAIIAVLAGILFPVFARAKAAAKQTQCLSNLKQIGDAITLYMNDYDDRFPNAVDPSDRYDPTIWDSFPAFKALIPSLPNLDVALQPYAKSKQIFHCPADSGSQVLDSHFPDPFVSVPTMFGTYGTSYLFRTEISFRSYSQSQFQLPASVNVLFDGAGHWHSGSRGLDATDNVYTTFDLLRNYRYNVLFGDMHAKNLTYAQLNEAWATPL